MTPNAIHTEAFSLTISTTIGNVTAEYTVPNNVTCVMTLAHGAGAGMNHSFMVELATTLAGLGIGTLRFNFPFAEKKQFKTDPPPVAHKTIEAAIAHAHSSYPSLPLFASGKSFGGRMSSQYLATHHNAPAKGIIFYGFPLHPAGKPSIERAAHLKDVAMPMLFLQGTRDTLATVDLITSVCASLPKATLITLEGADHSFKAKKENNINTLAKATVDWINNQQ